MNPSARQIASCVCTEKDAREALAASAAGVGRAVAARDRAAILGCVRSPARCKAIIAPWIPNYLSCSCAPSPRATWTTTARGRNCCRAARVWPTRSATGFPILLEEEARTLSDEELERLARAHSAGLNPSMGFCVLIPARLASTRLPASRLRTSAGNRWSCAWRSARARHPPRGLSWRPTVPSIVDACLAHGVEALLTREIILQAATGWRRPANCSACPGRETSSTCRGMNR